MCAGVAGRGEFEQDGKVLEAIAAKYGRGEYADVVKGIKPINEPKTWAEGNFSDTTALVQKAYQAVRN